MAIDISFRDTYSTSARDLSRFAKNFLTNAGVVETGLAVSQSDVPAMSVKVASGNAYFYGGGVNSSIMYEFESDSNEEVIITGSAVNPRIDIICLKVDTASQVASIVAIAGTPAPSNPTVPTTPASHYKLAEVAVGGGVTQITNANITDKRNITSLALKSYPVGSIYINTINTNPTNYFGGTWVAFGTGRTLVGVDTSQTEFDTVEETGGAKTHTLTTSEMPSHTHIQDSHRHTTWQHTNGTTFLADINGTGSTVAGLGLTFSATTNPQMQTGSVTATNQNTGGGSAHNNLQPYITVYMWKRTA
jgi:microcystin-dependent protein